MTRILSSPWRNGRRRLCRDEGMTTVEYTLGTLAAVGFVFVLYKVITSPMVSDGLTAVLRKALETSF